ncbi:unnamed protein product [Linum trigynum]|uniref:Uncharacterized protein n=1 Tax=Linum trigynum TaxID=586398 RepID=A0AAV2E725_9ROSI
MPRTSHAYGHEHCTFKVLKIKASRFHNNEIFSQPALLVIAAYGFSFWPGQCRRMSRILDRDLRDMIGEIRVSYGKLPQEMARVERGGLVQCRFHLWDREAWQSSAHPRARSSSTNSQARV